MEQIRTKVKRWGNSFGIILPMDVVNTQRIKEGSEVHITIESADRMKVEDIFNIADKVKLKKVDVKNIMKEIDEEFED